jgi:ABC-type lipoprotein release transport system permease subunit
MIIVKSDVENRQDYFNELFNSIQKKYPGAERIIDFTYDSNIANANRPQIVSCYFQQDSLEYKVEQFSTILDQETKYKIDMSKVENLKNLARVQQMGNTLSFCILLIVIVFISVFIYFLLNTHFQKIQRNLGTFKAFGVSESMIRRVYLLIIYNLIISSYMIAFAVSCGISFAVNTLVPITDDKGQYAIFDCIVWQNGALLLLTLLFATCTTILVVKKLLSHTPGDLIYNRNQD